MERRTGVAVTIAMVSWNTKALLERALASLECDASRGIADVWVVDNASRDGSADLVRERFEWANLVASSENLGFGRAVNVVAAQTSAPWLAPANADIALRPGALETLLAVGELDTAAGAVAPRLLLPDGSTQHSVFGFPTVPFSLALASGAYRRNRVLGDRLAFPGYWDCERARRVPWAVAAFLLVRRTAWEDVGGFDERQWMYAEDLDLGWRLHRSGWATRYEPRAHVDHESSASTSQLFGPSLEPHWQRSTYGFLARRRGAPYTWLIALINTTGAYLRWIKVALSPSRDRAAARDLRMAHAKWARVHLAALRSRKQLEEIS